MEAERSLSVVLPRFSIVRYPAATFAPLGVARLHACSIAISAEPADAGPCGRTVAQISAAASRRIEPYRSPADQLMAGRRRRPMMRLTIYSVAIVALIAVATFMLRSPSPSIELSAAAMPPLQELHMRCRSTSTPRPGHRGPIADLSNGGEALRTKLNLLSLMA